MCGLWAGDALPGFRRGRVRSFGGWNLKRGEGLAGGAPACQFGTVVTPHQWRRPPLWRTLSLTVSSHSLGRSAFPHPSARLPVSLRSSQPLGSNMPPRYVSRRRPHLIGYGISLIFYLVTAATVSHSGVFLYPLLPALPGLQVSPPTALPPPPLALRTTRSC